MSVAICPGIEEIRKDWKGKTISTIGPVMVGDDWNCLDITFTDDTRFRVFTGRGSLHVERLQ